MKRRNALRMIAVLMFSFIANGYAEPYPALVEVDPYIYYWENADVSQEDDCFDPEETEIRGMILPANLQSYWKYVNIQLPDLQFYVVEEGNEHFRTIDGVLFSKDGKRLIAYPCGKQDTEYRVPEGVQWIGEYAFAGNPFLEKVILPISVEGILNSGFSSCSNLREIHLNENLRLIGNGSFEHCQSLQTVLCPSTLQIIGSYAFRYSGLLHVELNDGLVSIGGEAFAYCDAPAFTFTLHSSLIDISPTFTYTPSVLLLHQNSLADMVQYMADHTVCYLE